MRKELRKVALLGNPNSGKSSLFNAFTGLNQKVGNFPGVTTERHSGHFSHAEVKYELVDFPGSYSLYARTEDEQVFSRSLLGGEKFWAVIVVVDASNLTRSLLLLTQIKDLGFNTVVALNMLDEAFRMGLRLDISQLSQRLDMPVVATNARTGEGVKGLREALALEHSDRNTDTFFNEKELESPKLLGEVRDSFDLPNLYWAHMYLQQQDALKLSTEDATKLRSLAETHEYAREQAQGEELKKRHEIISSKLSSLLPEPTKLRYKLSDRLDKVLMHTVYGTLIFVALLFLLFQSIFAWATPFMDVIDGGFSFLSAQCSSFLPESALTDLLTDGVLPGIGGVVIFVPQIAFLFLITAILEESGYMARVMSLSDKLMCRFGLSGRSIIPLVSGMACSIPAVMATRSIGHKKERLLTMFVVPLMSCSARLPVYTTLIGLIVLDVGQWGIFNVQGGLLFGLYALGTIATLGTAALLHWILPTSVRSFLVIELPPYRLPLLRNVFFTVYERVRSFVFEAGKVIVALSVVLWVLSSYGGEEAYETAYEAVSKTGEEVNAEDAASLRLKHSYIGQLGSYIEPVIAPLGYDWKIGIALLTSFVAREVFVSTLMVVYSMDAEDDAAEEGLQARLRAERHASTGAPVFTMAVCISLLVFYAFAMQCMSTLAVVYRETGNWSMPLLQFLYMGLLAYGGAWVCYVIFS